MNSLFSDFNKINNQDGKLYLGNKLLHIFFLINLASKFRLKLKLPKYTSLNDLFLLKEKRNYVNSDDFINIKLAYNEKSIFSKYNSKSKLDLYLSNFKNFFKNEKLIRSKLTEDSLKQFQDAKKFSEQLLSKNDFYISGNFWHFDLMPSQNIIENHITIKKDIIDKIKKKLPDIESRNTVVIHFRGGDFKNHLSTYFKKRIKLDKSYYEKAIKEFIKKFGKDYKFYLFSDENETLDEYLREFKLNKIRVDNQSVIEDWVCLMLSKNIIQSNSSFCWTASLFNKNISLQPKNGYGYNDNFGPIPYGFYMKNSIII